MVPKLLLAIQDDPGYPEPHRFLAVCYAHIGRPHSAREIVARLQTIASPLITDANCLRHPGHRELFLVPTNYQLAWGKGLMSFKLSLATANQWKSVTVRGWDRQTENPVVAA